MAHVDAGKLAVAWCERSIVEQAQKHVFSIAGGKASLAGVGIVERTGPENTLERINAVVQGGRSGWEATFRRAGGSAPAARSKARCGASRKSTKHVEGPRGYLSRPDPARRPTAVDVSGRFPE